MKNKLELLHHQFGQGQAVAVLEALALCRGDSVAVPAWVIDALLAKQEAVAVALKPPPQTIQPRGVDMAVWGGLDAKRGLELVPAGKAGRILGGRQRARQRRESVAAMALQDFLAVAYRAAIATGTSRARAITAVHTAALEANLCISRSQVDRKLKEAGLHRRRSAG
jgi:hypothetical protein